MFTICGKTIRMTRGDTLRAIINAETPSGSLYIPEAGDTVRFAMKKDWDSDTVILTKSVPIDTMMLVLEPEDTEDLDYGRYVFDVQLTYDNGDVDTFIPRGVLIITQEVS